MKRNRNLLFHFRTVEIILILISYISIGTWRQRKVDKWNIYIYTRTEPISSYFAWRLDLNINNHKDWQEDMINIQGYLKDLMDIAVAFEFLVCLRLWQLSSSVLAFRAFWHPHLPIEDSVFPPGLSPMTNFYLLFFL
jgi:hypothetical protein